MEFSNISIFGSTKVENPENKERSTRYDAYDTYCDKIMMYYVESVHPVICLTQISRDGLNELTIKDKIDLDFWRRSSRTHIKDKAVIDAATRHFNLSKEICAKDLFFDGAYMNEVTNLNNSTVGSEKVKCLNKDFSYRNNNVLLLLDAKCHSLEKDMVYADAPLFKELRKNMILDILTCESAMVRDNNVILASGKYNAFIIGDSEDIKQSDVRKQLSILYAKNSQDRQLQQFYDKLRI